jgi:hypothetical protein
MYNVACDPMGLFVDSIACIWVTQNMRGIGLHPVLNDGATFDVLALQVQDLLRAHKLKLGNFV